jgi:hypothetical protein
VRRRASTLPSCTLGRDRGPGPWHAVDMTGAPPGCPFSSGGLYPCRCHPCSALLQGFANGSMGSSPFRWDVGSFDREEGPPPPLDAPAPRPSPGRPPIESACGTLTTAMSIAVTVLVECSYCVCAVGGGGKGRRRANRGLLSRRDILLQIGVGGWLHRENHADLLQRCPGKARCMPGAFRCRGTPLEWFKATACLEKAIVQQQATDRLRGKVIQKGCCVSSGLMDSVIARRRRVLRREVGGQLAGRVSKRLAQGRRSDLIPPTKAWSQHAATRTSSPLVRLSLLAESLPCLGQHRSGGAALRAWCLWESMRSIASRD